VDVFRDKYGIDARVNHLVEQIDPDEKTVYGTETTTGKKFQCTYDKLLIATGVSPIVPPFKGSNLNGVHVLKTIPHADSIMENLADKQVEKVTIIGGGYIGLEMAESFKLLGKDVM